MSEYSYDPFTFATLEQKYQLPAGMLSSIKYAENSGDNAVSPKGAVGEMQTMPSTAGHPGYGVPAFDPKDPEGTAKYVKALYDRSGGNPILTAAAYNAGLGGDYTNAETKGYIDRFTKNFQGQGQPKVDQSAQPVIAELSDGRRLEFPAGTSPDVVQKTVKKVLSNGNPSASGGPPNGPLGGSAGSPVAGNLVGPVPGQKPLDWQQQLSFENLTKLQRQSPERAYAIAKKEPEFVPDIPGGGAAFSALGKDLGITGKAATPLQQAARDAQQAGYKVPPTQAHPTIVNKALESLGGKNQVPLLAAGKNAKVTNQLAARALGLPTDQPITQAALDQIQSQAGQQYDKLRALPFQLRVDPQYENEIANLSKNWNTAAKRFSFMKNGQIEDLMRDLTQKVTTKSGATAYNKLPPSDVVDAIKDLRFKMKANFAARDNPEKLALAQAQRKAAEALEALMERNLAQRGNFTQYSEFRNARMQIAKSIDVERALNKSTGNVSASYFANQLKKGKPLSGEMEDIAKAAAAFPSSTRDAEKIGSNPGFSIMDIFGSVMNPKWAAMLLGRPAIRELILSDFWQKQSPEVQTQMARVLGETMKAGAEAKGINDQPGK